MNKFPLLPCRKVVNALLRLGFVFVDQDGSHIKLKRKIPGYGTQNIIIPNHNPVKRGTLKSALSMGGVSLKDFLDAL